MDHPKNCQITVCPMLGTGARVEKSDEKERVRKRERERGARGGNPIQSKRG